MVVGAVTEPFHIQSGILYKGIFLARSNPGESAFATDVFAGQPFGHVC